MGQPAARLSDMHVCPMVTGVVPHVGGPIIPPTAMNVLIGGLPAATVSSMCVCAGGPDTIVKGSSGVFIGGLPAARMGDMTAHGGNIVLGCMTVLIGETGGGGGGGAGGGGGSMGAAQKMKMDNSKSLKDAAKNGDKDADKTKKDDFTASFALKDDAEKGVSNRKYTITTNDGQVHEGKTDGSGNTPPLNGYTTADCSIVFSKQ